MLQHPFMVRVCLVFLKSTLKAVKYKMSVLVHNLNMNVGRMAGGNSSQTVLLRVDTETLEYLKLQTWLEGNAIALSRCQLTAP